LWTFESLYAFLCNCFRVILVESSWIGRQYIVNTLVFIFLQCDLLFGTGSHECYALLDSPSRQLSWDKKNSLDYLVWSTLDVARLVKTIKAVLRRSFTRIIAVSNSVFPNEFGQMIWLEPGDLVLMYDQIFVTKIKRNVRYSVERIYI